MALDDDIFNKLEDDTEEVDYSGCAPIDNPESECYKCDVGMCSQCRGEQYVYEVDRAAWFD